MAPHLVDRRDDRTGLSQPSRRGLVTAHAAVSGSMAANPGLVQLGCDEIEERARGAARAARTFILYCK